MKRSPTRILPLIILSLLAACQPTSVPDAPVEIVPTLYVLPTTAPTFTPAAITPTFAPLPTFTPSATIPLPTVTPSATITPTPAESVVPAGIATVTAVPPSPVPPTPLPARPASALPDAFVFGASVQGRDLLARRLGGGETALMLVGGIHGGWEGNTVTLVEQLIAHFEANPGQILPGLSLVLVPSLNPDGATLGRTLAGRFNARGVDLNRNWDCGWSEEAFFQSNRVDPGAAPFSEPETTAIAALINDVRPAVVLFYHSAADGVFVGNCGEQGGVSDVMGAIYGGATGYSYGASFDAYPVTGTAASWVDSLGIPAADVELTSADSPEFERNLRGVMALQCWLLGPAAELVSLCR